MGHYLKKFFSFCLFLLILPVFPTVYAEVSLQNGNFYTSAMDLEYLSGLELKVERIYNSKSDFKGMFGWGWGSEFDVYLTEHPDGSVVIHEFGGGKVNRFTSLNYDASLLQEDIKNLVSIAEKSGALGSRVQLEKYKRTLEDDVDFRMDEWSKFARLNKIAVRKNPESTRYYSPRYLTDFVAKTSVGFVRVAGTGKNYTFFKNGQLARVTDKAGNFFDLTYGKDGHLQKVVDNFNLKIFFEFNSQALVSKIEGENNTVLQYAYNEWDELISVDTQKSGLVYKYDAQKKHLLKGVSSNGKEIQQIQYYSPAVRENVKSVRNESGGITEYSYSEVPFGRVVTVKQSDKGILRSVIRYESQMKKRADGTEWLFKLIKEGGGLKVDTIYEERCELPLSIGDGKQSAFFKYDEKCRLISKETPIDKTVITYHPTVGKVSALATYARESDTSKDQPLKVSKFEYNRKGKLVHAETSDNRKVNIAYDQRGRILGMKDQDNDQLLFKYDERSKPVSIAHSVLGTIFLEYSNNGEVKKVTSPQGPQVQADVIRFYENLLALINSAGVKLSF